MCKIEKEKKEEHIILEKIIKIKKERRIHP